MKNLLPQSIALDTIATAWKVERDEPAAPAIEPIPDDGSPAAKNFRAPVPYRRLKPAYTRTAYLYDITATVEATVDLDEKGQITNLAITRWAGYELDESVEKAVRSMNWRPAERSGKSLPIRFLLRYNFKKIDKDDTDNE
jgi:TonB family protein